jgi:hypothetical protein
MARQPANPTNKPTHHEGPPTDAKLTPEGNLVVTSHAPVENLPETDGGMTAAAATAITPTYDKGPTAGLLAASEEPLEEKPVVHRFRVLADRPISAGGSRTTLRAGKEIDSLNYNIRDLRQQGVQLQAIDEFGNPLPPA